MSASRLAALPIDHLVAEMAAFPLASEAALQLRIVALDPALSGPTGDLWREAERRVLGSFPAFSVDEAIAIRDRIWFTDRSFGAVPLHSYLRRLAGHFLEVHGPVALLRPPGDPGQRRSKVPGLAAPDPEPREARARWTWRWLSLALPPDLLLAGLAGNGRAPATVDLLSPTLRLLLKDRGYAETHLHLGAAIDFGLLWLGALFAVASPETKADAFASPGAALGEGRDLAPWLLRAAIGRCVLASHLKRPPGDPDHLAGFVTEILAPRVAGDAGAVVAASLHACLDNLLAGRLGGPVPGFADLRGLYWALTGGSLAFEYLPEALDEAQAADPIAGLFPPERGAPPTPEMRFVGCALRYLGETPKDHDFAVLFWQVVRVRSLFYRHVVQRPMTSGLQWFIRFYDRIKPARRPIDKLRVESAAKLAGAGAGLRSLELRTGPEASGSKLRAFVDKAHSAAEQVAVEIKERFGCDLELGLVFHFTKDRGGGAREGIPRAQRGLSHGDPNANPTGYRYARFYNGKRHEALALRWMLWRYPRSLALIRGIDVATDELGVPTWVLAPLFRYLRALSEAAAAVAPDGPDTLVPLRCTAHAGEDFVHLLTGLRNVEEAVRRLGLRAGDRIGHGVSLGRRCPGLVPPHRAGPARGRRAAPGPRLGMGLVRARGIGSPRRPRVLPRPRDRPPVREGLSETRAALRARALRRVSLRRRGAAPDGVSEWQSAEGGASPAESRTSARLPHER